MYKKKTGNFLIAFLLVAASCGYGYYYFEGHSMLDVISNRNVVIYSLYYSLIMGGITWLYALITQKGWNSFFYFHSLLMNFCFTAGAVFMAVEYGTFYFRGKILLYTIAVFAAFVLQTLLYFVSRKRAKGVSQ